MEGTNITNNIAVYTIPLINAMSRTYSVDDGNKEFIHNFGKKLHGQ
jgi:hypothetical protein